MTLTTVTAAGAPTNVANSEQKPLILFGDTSASQTSATFTVDQYPFYLAAFNLGSDDVVAVQQVWGSGSGVETAPFAPINGQVQLVQSRTKVRIDYPGRYQLVHTGSSPLGTFTVMGFNAVMAAEPIGDIAEALASSLQTFQNKSAYNYINLGTVGSPANLDFSINRAYKMVIQGNFLTDIEVTALPKQPSFLYIKVTQPAGGNQAIQFADLFANFYWGPSSIQPAQNAGTSTVYVFYWDGESVSLVSFGSSDQSVGG